MMYMRVVSVLTFFSLAGGLIAAEAPLAAEGRLVIQDFDEYQSTFMVNMPDWELGSVTLQSGEYQRILSDLSGEIRLTGAPHLPTTSTLVAVPEEGALHVEYSYAGETILSDVDLVPFQAVQLEAEGVARQQLPDREIYQTDAWYPAEPVFLHDRAKLRDIALVTVEVTPFQYNPVRRELRVLEGMQVAVSHDEALHAPNKPVSRFFEPIYQSLFPNYPMVMPDHYQTPSILYITPNNATVDLIMETLVDWRHEKGFEVHVANTALTGSSNSSIKSYIQTAYDTWPNPPEFVCLVGDVGGGLGIPTFYEGWSWYNGEGDHPFVHLDGGDYISDAFVGRLTFSSTSQLTNIIAKIVNYEKQPYVDDTNWFTRALLVGDPSASGLSTIMTNRFIDELSQYHGYSNNFLVFSGSFEGQMASGLNAGVSFFNYRGYLGMSGWDNSNTNSLSNGPKLPFVTILTCGTGGFAGSSRAEQFLKVGTAAVPKGGIGAVGTATSGTHTLYNNCVAGGIYQGIFNEKIYYAGAALERGRLNLNMSYPSNNNNFVEIFSHWNNLMGDPVTEFWTGIPGNLTVTVPAELPVASRWLSVLVENDLGLPVKDSWVTALQEGDSVFVSAYTDENGVAQLSLEGLVEGDLTVTVTKHNFIPSQSTVGVAAGNVAVLIDDVTLVESSGNGDGIVNAAESADLTYSVLNSADTTVNDVTILVTHEDGTVLSDFYLSSLDASELHTSSPINIDIPADYPGVADLDVKFEIGVDGSGWNDHRRFEITAPYLSVIALNEGGTAIPSFDPGEITDLVVSLKNVGRNATTGLSATLTCENPDLTIEVATADFNAAGAGEGTSNEDAPFSINLSSQLTVGVQVPMNLDFSDENGYIQSIQILLPIGTPSVGDPLGPDRYGYLGYDTGDLAYAMSPTYDWIEIKPGLGGFSGDLVNLSDYGENQEDIETVALPFNFGFYGIDYYEIGVGSNGYISLGESDQAVFRNWRLPGALGPSPMIAAFWDDLKLGGSAGVYTFFNSVDHYFVIEWYDMINRYNNSTRETFEIILFDPDYYGSEDGNGDILIQYKEFNNVNANNGGSAHHGNYATIGLENEDASDGLEYSHNNTYPVQAMPLSDETAILFTTRTDAILPCPGWARADINHDGQQNVQDLVILVNILLGSTSPGECEFWAADMSYDSTLTVGDLVLMVNEVMGYNLGRDAGVDPSASVILDQTGLALSTTGDVRAFMLDVETSVEPILNQIEGVELMKEAVGNSWRILGYSTTAPIPDLRIAFMDPEDADVNSAQAADGGGQAIEVETVVVPAEFAVTAVYPNPFNPTVNIDYSLPDAGEASIRVYNALGQLVFSDRRSQALPGEYTFTWNGISNAGQTVASGIYFARINAPTGSELVKLTMLK